MRYLLLSQLPSWWPYEWVSCPQQPCSAPADTSLWLLLCSQSISYLVFLFSCCLLFFPGKNYLPPNVNSAKAEEPWHRLVNFLHNILPPQSSTCMSSLSSPRRLWFPPCGYFHSGTFGVTELQSFPSPLEKLQSKVHLALAWGSGAQGWKGLRFHVILSRRQGCLSEAPQGLSKEC